MKNEILSVHSPIVDSQISEDETPKMCIRCDIADRLHTAMDNLVEASSSLNDVHPPLIKALLELSLILPLWEPKTNFLASFGEADPQHLAA